MTTQPAQNEESLPTDIPGVIDAIARYEAKTAAFRATIRELAESENFSIGKTHATEIHALKQQLIPAEFSLTLLKSRLSRLKQEEADAPQTQSM